MPKIRIPNWMRPVPIVLWAIILTVIAVVGSDTSLLFRILIGTVVFVFTMVILDAIIEKR